MAEAVLTGLATEAVKALIQLVFERASTDIGIAWGLNDHLEVIKENLENIQPDLERASNSNNSEKMKRWLQRVKDVAYEADDVLDEHAIEMIRREREPKNRCTDKLRSFFTPHNPLLFRIRMALKFRKILSMFQELKEAAREYGLNRVREKESSNSYSYDDNLSETRKRADAYASEFVGREDDIEKLLEMICCHSNEERPLSTIAIIGMGGLGKTTLAKRIYNDVKISNHFPEKLWTCVSESEGFDTTRILNDMIESVTASEADFRNLDAIDKNLQEKLKGKKFLLVLDDVWNESQEAWDSLLNPLRRIGGLPGSVILITTRSNGVAEAARASFKHKLKGLSEEESWSLFVQKVSVNGTSLNHSQEEIGRKIVVKCNGVPLAIKVSGGLLNSKKSLQEWDSIEKSELWDLPHDQNKILPSLMLSFNHLPYPNLKQCFAYLSIFPRNRYMCKNELIGVWSSQGYLCKTGNRTSVEIGEDYLRRLLNSSLLHEVGRYGNPTVHYNLHDLVYDLAVYVSGNDLVRQGKDLQEKGNYRHLRVTLGMNNTISECPPEKALRKLRTICSMKKLVPWNMLIQARYLHTLFLIDSSITELPPDIGLLKHLRYLDLSFNPIQTLPDSIGKLYQLQTLVLHGCLMTKLPKVVYKLVNLRCILTIDVLLAWKGLAQLTNLQVLPCLYLEADGEGWSIDELGKLDQLRDEISIHGLEFVKDKEEAKNAKLAVKAMVSKLTLSWSKREASEGVSDGDVLDGLEPHPNIASLKVENFNGEKFPPWITTMTVLTEQQRGTRTLLSNLTLVELLSCSKCSTLPTLGQLPLLECLTLNGFNVDCIGDELYGGENLHKPAVVSFQRLRKLTIRKFRKLTTWTAPTQEAFPRLETLKIIDCCLLESVPALSIRSLMKLHLMGLSNMKSLDFIKYSTRLTKLFIFELPLITSLPKELESLVYLQQLVVLRCRDFKCLPDDLLHTLSLLIVFEIADCPSLRNIPTSLEGCTSLKHLKIHKCPMIECAPANFGKLQSLSELTICPYPAKLLKYVLESIQHLPQLLSLEISGFRDEEEMRDCFSGITPINCLPSLRGFTLIGCPNIKTLPRQLEHLTRIEHLCIKKFEDLDSIPDWICNITSLWGLSLDGCKNLKGLPVKEVWQRLPRLHSLKVSDCPLLSEGYAKDTSSEWHNISHINDVAFDLYQHFEDF